MSSTTTGIVRIDRSGLRHRTDLLGWRLSARINRARFVDAICSAVCSTNTGQLHERLCAPHRFIAGERQGQRELIDHKLAELAEQQHRIEVARTALEHGRQCPASEPMNCSRFWSIIEGRQRGLSLEESHARAH